MVPGRALLVGGTTDGQQTITQRYSPWGTIRPDSINTLPTDYTFTGQELDESTGLMYYGARYYDPALGRFVQADTIVPNPAGTFHPFPLQKHRLESVEVGPCAPVTLHTSLIWCIITKGADRELYWINVVVGCRMSGGAIWP